MKNLILACLCLFTCVLRAQEPPAPDIKTESTATQVEAEADVEWADDQDADEEDAYTNEIVSVGHDSTLAAGKKATSVVSILGSATSAGEVSDEVVAVLGDVHVTGPVGRDVVAVLGNVYVDSHVGGDVVSVLGEVKLGPHAEIDGDLAAVGGNLKRDAAALVHGSVENIGGAFFNVDGLRPWLKECLRYGRPLAIAPGLGWAWGLALGFLALYVLFALLFRDGVERCVRTLETQPGRSILTAFLTLLLVPMLFVLLIITVIGIAVVPFLTLGLVIASLFGKAVVLAWIGGSVTRSFRSGSFAHPAVAVLIGGVIVLGLYLVPVLGFIVSNVVGLVGLGVVIYTLIQSTQRNRSATAAAAAPAAQLEPAPPPVAPESRIAPSADAATLPRAGFWIRMGALFLDAILVGVMLAFLRHSGSLEFLVLAIYGAIMWKLKGTTIGGIVCNLKVVRLDDRPIDWSTAIVRALGCFLSLAVAGLGFIWIVFDEDKQAWHDKIAGTVVVRTPKGVSLV